MMTLKKLFVDMFDKPELSNNEIVDFATSHVASLQKDTSGKYTTIATTTDGKLSAYKAALLNSSASSGVQKSSTATKAAAKKELLDFIRVKEGVVKDVFRKQPAVIIEFYPKGLQEYNKCKIGDWEKLANRYLDTAKKYAAKVGADFVTEATALVINFIEGRSQQVGDISDNTSNAKAIYAFRKPLTVQLSQNVYTIASDNIDNPAASAIFFDESLLYNKGKKKAAKEVK